MYTDMDLYAKVRRAVMVDAMPSRVRRVFWGPFMASKFLVEYWSAACSP